MIEPLQLLRSAVAAEFPALGAVAFLATVDPQGNPRVRSIVCRRIDDDAGVWIVTDARSAKIEDLESNPRAELCFWLPRRREQFRISGNTEIATSFIERDALWRQLPESTRVHLLWPPPGLPRQGAAAFPFAFPEGEPVPAAFTALVLRSDLIDLLELNFHPHRRRRWRREHHWLAEEINP